MIILAAGEGTRLRPLTDDCPKCLVEVADKPVLNWQLDAAERLGLRYVSLVTGYRADQIQDQACRLYHNPEYASTNMVESLWCAQAEFQDEFIVSYGDIIYEDKVLRALIDSDAAISVVIDMEWLSYWQARFDDPLTDAESLRLDEDWRIQELGQKPASIEEIQGQYIGLMKFKGAGITTLQRVYAGLGDRSVGSPDARPFRKMYMTDLLQAIVDAGNEVRAVPVNRGWLEVDSVSDLDLANRNVLPGPEGPRISI